MVKLRAASGPMHAAGRLPTEGVISRMERPQQNRQSAGDARQTYSGKGRRRRLLGESNAMDHGGFWLQKLPHILRGDCGRVRRRGVFFRLFAASQKSGQPFLPARKRPCEESSRCFATTGQVLQVRTDQPGKCSKCAPTFLVRTQFSQNNTIENAKKERSLSGRNPRNRFPAWSGKCRLYSKALRNRNIAAVQNLEESRQGKAAEAEEATAKKSAAEEAEEDRGLAAVQSAVELLQEKMDLLLHRNNTRCKDHLRLPSEKRNWGKQRTCYHAFKDWNALDSDLKNSDTVCQFKRNFLNLLVYN